MYFGPEGEIKAGIGILDRDDNGTQIQAWSVTRDGINNLVVAEVEAARVALLGHSTEWLENDRNTARY